MVVFVARYCSKTNHRPNMSFIRSRFVSCYIDIHCKGMELVLFGLVSQRYIENLNNMGVRFHSHCFQCHEGNVILQFLLIKLPVKLKYWMTIQIRSRNISSGHCFQSLKPQLSLCQIYHVWLSLYFIQYYCFVATVGQFEKDIHLETNIRILVYTFLFSKVYICDIYQ